MIQALKRQKIEAGQELKPEPDATETETIRVVIKLPNGTRLERRFSKSDSLKVCKLFLSIINEFLLALLLLFGFLYGKR